MASEAGKGSAQRPGSISQKEWDTRWDEVFGRTNDTESVVADSNEVTCSSEETVAQQG